MFLVYDTIQKLKCVIVYFNVNFDKINWENYLKFSGAIKLEHT